MFKLHIPVTRASIDRLKADLTKSLPEVKSSHRVEAMARGLGFRTYAAVRAATDGEANAGRREVDGATFGGYLAEHGIAADTSALHLAAGRIALNEVMARVPELNENGLGAGDRQRVNGALETVADRARRIEERRAGFACDRSVEQFLRALACVSRLAPIRRIDRRAHSYDLKHIAEQLSCTYPEGQPLGPDYVSNGALIAAAIHAGFAYRQVVVAERSEPSLNAVFAMSPRSIAVLRAVRDRELELRRQAA